MLPCQGCAYRRDIPSDAHIACAFDWDPMNTKGTPIAHPVSKRVEQWYLFPFNYDPLWGPDTCVARAETIDPEKLAPKRPLFDLISILGGRRF
jgi:hypothetical protein